MSESSARHRHETVNVSFRDDACRRSDRGDPQTETHQHRAAQHATLDAERRDLLEQ
ncbi:MAG TPA: hypothetical protein VEL28_11805 [Candidatus Binatia bacterium]|nr:hypothetical protein [Candidatus Binatia bacterium]